MSQPQIAVILMALALLLMGCFTVYTAWNITSRLDLENDVQACEQFRRYFLSQSKHEQAYRARNDREASQIKLDELGGVVVGYDWAALAISLGLTGVCVFTIWRIL